MWLPEGLTWGQLLANPIEIPRDGSGWPDPAARQLYPPDRPVRQDDVPARLRPPTWLVARVLTPPFLSRLTALAAKQPVDLVRDDAEGVRLILDVGGHGERCGAVSDPG